MFQPKLKSIIKRHRLRQFFLKEVSTTKQLLSDKLFLMSNRWFWIPLSAQSRLRTTAPTTSTTTTTMTTPTSAKREVMNWSKPKIKMAAATKNNNTIEEDGEVIRDSKHAFSLTLYLSLSLSHTHMPRTREPHTHTHFHLLAYFPCVYC